MSSILSTASDIISGAWSSVSGAASNCFNNIGNCAYDAVKPSAVVALTAASAFGAFQAYKNITAANTTLAKDAKNVQAQANKDRAWKVVYASGAGLVVAASIVAADPVYSWFKGADAAGA